jgi:hypothetical protein
MGKNQDNKRAGDDRKLASDHGRANQKSGGEAQKKRHIARGSARRTGSSKKLG